ncbi:MAG: sulfotransferase family protein [Rhodanobacteraceae bacterium]|nr:MAG: sulfotransferase family protein [Rhodanobacteraceae bacterium]
MTPDAVFARALHARCRGAWWRRPWRVPGRIHGAPPLGMHGSDDFCMSTTRSIEGRWQRAREYLRTSQFQAAQVQLESLRAMAPDDARTCVLAAQMAWHHGRVRESAAFALTAARIVADHPEVLSATVEALLQAGEMAAARALLDRPAWRSMVDIEALTACAGYCQDFNEPAMALATLDRIAMLLGDNAPLQLFRGQQLEYLGRLAEAEACYLRCLRLDPGCGRAAYWLARLPRQKILQQLRPAIETGLSRAPRGTHMHAAFEFAQYHVLEALGRYDDAWSALVRGNAEMRVLSASDTPRHREVIRRLMDGLSSSTLGYAKRNPHGPCPIFVIGLPRSGTTLLERMLSNHSKVAAAGELVDFTHTLLWSADTRPISSDAFLARLPALDWSQAGQRYLSQTAWRAQGKSHFVDKGPTNWKVAGLIQAALPQSRILNMVRDPLDVCFGNWRAMFGDAYSWNYDFADLAEHYRDYSESMRMWREAFPGAVLDVHYAELVREPAAVLRRVFDFCGLPWEAGCEDPSRNAAPVTTLSSAQVREPLHTRGLGGWRRYAVQLEPLRQLLQAGLCDEPVGVE